VVSPIVIEDHCFVGNFSVVSNGASLKADSMVGSLSQVGPERQFARDSVILGLPGRPLNMKAKFEVSDEDSYGITGMLLIGLFLVVLKQSVLIGCVMIAVLPLFFLPAWILGSWYLLLILPLIVVPFMVCLTIVLLATKWIVIGRFKAGAHVFGGSWYYYRFFLGEVYDLWLTHVGEYLMANESICRMMRWLGASIGRNVLLESADVLEFDLMSIGDNVITEEHSMVQPHTFEHKIFKMQPVVVGKGCFLGRNSILFPGAQLSDRVYIKPHTLILREEELPANSTWEGNPSRFVSNSYSPL